MKYITRSEMKKLVNLINAEIKTTEFIINKIEYQLNLLKIISSLIAVAIIILIIIFA
jgi:hypothetical protein